jgi:hypothetical protein
MPEPAGEDRQAKFFFEYDPSYRLVGANGIWGGVTPRGDLRLDFFVESIGIPEHVTNLITPDGKLGPELGRTPERRFSRRLLVGVLLSMEQAESVAEFIQERVQQFKKMQERK